MSSVIQTNYIGNASTTQYNFTFPYLKASDIKVSLDAANTTNFSFANATTIQFTAPSGGATATQEAGGAPKTGVKIKIFRETGVDSLTATFYAGSAIKSEDLNDNFTQNLYKTQEVGQRSLSALGGTMTGNFNLAEDVDIVFEGASDNANETTLTVADPTADRTITFPDTTGTVITTGDTGTVTGTMLADGTVTSTDIADGTIVNADVNASAAIAGTKISPDFGSQNIATTGTVNNLTTTELAILDGATVTTAELNKLDGVTATTAELNIVDGVTATTAEINKLDGVTADTTELNLLDGVTASTAEINKLDGVTATTAELNLLDGVTASTSEINLLDGVTATTAEINKLDGVTATTAEINYVDGVTSNVQTQLNAKQPLDSELTTLAGMQSGTASILADSTALTSTTTELNQLDGKTLGETSLTTTSNTAIPTSKAVSDFISSTIAPLGGFEVVATEVAFPNTQPSAGVVISISDAGGVVFNGSGTSTTGRTVGGSTVTINNAPSSLNSETLAAGVGLMVSSTGSGQIYNYHKILGKEDDIKQLSDDINDFNARYRVFAGEPGSNNDEGDLVYDTNANKMKVYDNSTSAWKEVTSTGDFKYLFLCPAGGTGAPTLNGSIATYDLREGSNSGSAAAVTSAAQLLVSINGVVQKANTGTSAPAEGFALVDGNTIIFGSNLASGDSVFIIQFGSALTITTPGDNTVSTVKLQNLACAQGKIANEAINEAKLQVSNSPVNGYVLTAQSGNTGGMTWELPAAGATGGNSNANGVFWENQNTVTHDYTIQTNYNAGSFGPLTINNGVTVTVPNNSVWTIV